MGGETTGRAKEKMMKFQQDEEMAWQGKIFDLTHVLDVKKVVDALVNPILQVEWDLGEELPEKEHEEYKAFIQERIDKFAFSTKELGRHKNYKFCMKLNTSKPVFTRQYRLSQFKNQIVEGSDIFFEF